MQAREEQKDALHIEEKSTFERTRRSLGDELQMMKGSLTARDEEIRRLRAKLKEYGDREVSQISEFERETRILKEFIQKK